jgi:hypothetical protein
MMEGPAWAGADPGFANGGAEYGERVEREPITGSGAEPPAGSRGGAPGGVRGRNPLKLKNFGVFHIKTCD